jgi:hypothetical protein
MLSTLLGILAANLTPIRINLNITFGDIPTDDGEDSDGYTSLGFGHTQIQEDQ